MKKGLVTKIMLSAVFALVTAAPRTANAYTFFGGVVSGNYRIRAFDSHTFNTISFRGGSLAEVYVSGDGDTDLDLYIYNHRGQLVAKDDDFTDECLARWVPCCTGVYRIVVVNRGRVYNDYFLRAR